MSMESFQELNKVAGWWQIRPTDRGDGQGYSGFAMYVKPKNMPMKATEIMSDDLQDLIDRATDWCHGMLKDATPQPTSKTTSKRVIPRS